jgi:hypothetical protein
MGFTLLSRTLLHGVHTWLITFFSRGNSSLKSRIIHQHFPLFSREIKTGDRKIPFRDLAGLPDFEDGAIFSLKHQSWPSTNFTLAFSECQSKIQSAGPRHRTGGDPHIAKSRLDYQVQGGEKEWNGSEGSGRFYWVE